MMSLDEQLAELLARLGVELEEPADGHIDDHTDESGEREQRARGRNQRARFSYGVRAADEAQDAEAEQDGDAWDDLDANIHEMSEMSLFQTSREHYGVFYRLDLAGGLPQLRVFLPDDEAGVKMRCYFVRAAPETPLHEWFASAREHEGSQAFDDARDAAQQHLLFAVGELMKRLFWGGDVEQMRFPDEIQVVRLL